MSLKLPIPTRVPLLYVILGVLLAISVVPMYFYSVQTEKLNREALETNEKMLQNTITRSLADDISQHQETLRMMLANLSSSIQVASGNDMGAQHIEAKMMMLVMPPAVLKMWMRLLKTWARKLPPTSAVRAIRKQSAASSMVRKGS